MEKQVTKLLSIHNLKAAIKNKTILNGINLDIQKGEIHAIMGPNGSGKSTLTQTLMGNPKYTISNGEILFENQSINELSPDKKAQLGIFLAFQYPYEIEGLKVKNFLRHAHNSIYNQTEKQLNLTDFRSLLQKNIHLLKIDPSFLERNLNIGFSGGEKKQLEILQMAILQPKLAILDEIDSGLDINALKTVCDCINTIKSQNPDLSLLIITHYARILKYLEPDFVHILKNGIIVKSGSKELAQQIEASGYN